MASRADAEAAAALLRRPATVRERAATLLARAEAGLSDAFIADPARLAVAADEVAAVTRARYPTLAIPCHSRWRHFEAGGVDRRGRLAAVLAGRGAGAAEVARAEVDVAVVSVLLDAGAGPGWRYVEPATGVAYTRSEGLAVASFDAFLAGAFAGDGRAPRVDAEGLRRLDADRLARAFQVDAANPLVGLAGRAALLRRVGDALAANPTVFGDPGRPGGLHDALVRTGGRAVHLPDVLETIVVTLGPAWPSGQALDGIALGDCWRHPAIGGDGASAGWMPFHKLSQWLTYSLVEPLEAAGLAVSGLDGLTGLPEYRNGGLFLDTGVLVPRDAGAARRTWPVGDPFVVEWRALTVALLDRLAPLVRERLGASAAQMPLPCVLEGGTWAAGRALAQRLRGGLAPLTVASDGTVF